MKLSFIAEAKSNEPIRDSAKSLGDLISFIKTAPDSPEYKELMAFLSKPTFRTWNKAKWVVDSCIKKAVESQDNALMVRAKSWAFLNNLTDPTIASSVYDMDAKSAKDTPADRYAQSKSQRDKMKKALGPLGYVSMLSNLGKDSTPSKIKKLVKDTSRNSLGTSLAAMKDLPNVRSVPKF